MSAATLKQQLAAMCAECNEARALVTRLELELATAKREREADREVSTRAQRLAQEHLSTRLANGVQLENLRDKNAALERDIAKATAERKLVVETHAKLVEGITDFALRSRAWVANFELPAVQRRAP